MKKPTTIGAAALAALAAASTGNTASATESTPPDAIITTDTGEPTPPPPPAEPVIPRDIVAVDDRKRISAVSDGNEGPPSKDPWKDRISNNGHHSILDASGSHYYGKRDRGGRTS